APLAAAAREPPLDDEVRGLFRTVVGPEPWVEDSLVGLAVKPDGAVDERPAEVRGHERGEGAGGAGETTLSGEDDVRSDPPNGSGDDPGHRREVHSVERVVPDPDGARRPAGHGPREHAFRSGRADREDDDVTGERVRPLERRAVRTRRHDEPVPPAVTDGAPARPGFPELEIGRGVEAFVGERERDHGRAGRGTPPVAAPRGWLSHRSSATSRTAMSPGWVSPASMRAQKGHAVATTLAPVCRASAIRSAAIREPWRTSTHAPPPPAPQQNVCWPFRGISMSPSPDAASAARVARG